MNSVERLNWNLHKWFTFLHHFVSSITDSVNYCAPSTRNSKAFDDINLLTILESAAIDFHSLTNTCAHRMLGIDHCPRIFLEDEYRFRWTPEVVEEQLEWDFMPNLRKLVNLLKSVVDLLLILLCINLLWFFKWVEVVRELQSANSIIITL